MSDLVIVYDVLLFVSVPVAAWIVIMTWRWRQAPGAVALMVQMIGEGWWTLCYALQLSAAVRPEPSFWVKLMFVGVVMIPPAFLVWASRFTGHDRWISRPMIALLLIEPILFNLCVWTDPWHGLFTGPYRSGQGFIGGIGFWLHTAYCYSLMMIGGALLILNWIQSAPAYRRQAFLVLLGLPIAALGNVVTIFRLTPASEIDYTPIGFLASGAIFTYAQLRHRLFDLLPIARHTVVEGMRDGVLVLDTGNRIIDINPAAQEMLRSDVRQSIGQPAGAVLPVWPEIEGRSPVKRDIQMEFSIGGDRPRNVDLRMTVLVDRQSRPGGKLIVLRDITHIKTIEAALRESNESLIQRLQEIQSLQVMLKEQVMHDPLTGLYNRRFLEETLRRELAQAERAREPLSLALIDLDHFKVINDTYGHSFGDDMLIALGNLLSNNIRAGDVACRFGGEEFIVIMPGAPLNQAVRRVDEWRQAFSALRLRTESGTFSATFSAGLAGYPEHGSSDKVLLDTADRAMYAAKATGRNRVTAWESASDPVQDRPAV